MTADPASVDPEAFAAQVAQASDDDLRGLMDTPEIREAIVDQVFTRMAAHFRADKAGDLRKVFQAR